MGSLGPEPELFVGGDWMQTCCLDLQHHVILKKLGYLLPQTITKWLSLHQDDPSLRIADIATGTGIAAIHLAREYPKATVYGLDKSDSQFPHKIAWPSNLHFNKIDVFDWTTTLDFQEAFDVIHVRYMIPAFQEKGPELVVRNLLSMLKPGGYLCWHELCLPWCSTVDMMTLTHTGVTPRCNQIMGDRTSIFQSTRWMDHLDTVLEKAGFDEIEIIDPPVNQQTLHEETRIILWTTHREALAVSSSMPNEQDGAKEHLQAWKELETDILERGTLYSYLDRIAVARKPVKA